MRKINNAYLATAKNGSVEDVLSKLPECPGGYTVIFSPLSQKEAIALLKRTSECDEDLHPLMYGIIHLSCIKKPIEAVYFLLEKGRYGELIFDLTISEQIEQLQAWLHENREQLEVLSSMCPGSNILEMKDDKFCLLDFDVTPETEKKFLIAKKEKETKKERTLRLKRDKIISAISALMSYENVRMAEEKGDMHTIKIFSYTFACHLIRFAAGASIVDGVNRQLKRREGGSESPDREGIRAMLRKFDKQYPGKKPLELWKIVTDFLIAEKIYRPKKGYSVRFELEPTNTGAKGGRIIQEKSKQEPHPMGFQAFTNALKDIRN